mmetsp:Transcript_12628/g.19637  ORF Transcript_12628/g.19637 Transcript_12628/m.19637 type:complete len:134 (-) Transcript_12628:970-1371(-)
MGSNDNQIDSTKKKDEKKKEENPKDEKGVPLTEQDIALITRYGKGPYFESIRNVESDIKDYITKITGMCGVKESDTGLALPAQWNLQQDAMMMKQESTLQVGRCTKILNKESETDAKYIVHLKHMGKFVVGLD